MYNVRAFFAVDVLVHVGAPVREVVLHGKRYTLPASPLRTLPACISILGRLLSPPASRHSSFRPRGPSPSVPGISRLVCTRLIQMNPRIVRCISRETNWILKIKKRRSRSPRTSRTYRNPRIHGRRIALHGLWMLLFLFCVLQSILARTFFFVFVNARFVIVSARVCISSIRSRFAGSPYSRFSPTRRKL